MAMEKFKAAQLAFARKIGDAVTLASDAGNILSATERDTYINLALNELFRKYWAGVQGDSKKFLEIFPELLKSLQITTTAGGIFTLAAANTYDFFKIIDAYTVSGSSYIKFLEKTKRTIVITQANLNYVPSTSNFLAFEVEGILEFYPASSFNAQNVRINYIRRPVDPSTGSEFSNGGSNDIPFYAIWIEEIAEIAYQLWKTNQQERA